MTCGLWETQEAPAQSRVETAPPHPGYLRVALQLLLHLSLPESFGHQGRFF